jgi:hypothetical protein
MNQLNLKSKPALRGRVRIPDMGRPTSRWPARPLHAQGKGARLPVFTHDRLTGMLCAMKH